MRKLWVKAWVTLDGVFDADTMSLWWPPAHEAAVDYAKRLEYIAEEYLRGDTYLLGRTTYEMLWPGWSKDTTSNLGSILHRMNKYVVSNTLTAAPWEGSSIISGNVVEEITRLKQQPGKDIIIDGSATLVQSLMGTGLIDEFRFLVQPFIVGRGEALLPGRNAPNDGKTCGKQTAEFWIFCACLPAQQRMTDMAPLTFTSPITGTASGILPHHYCYKCRGANLYRLDTHYRADPCRCA